MSQKLSVERIFSSPNLSGDVCGLRRFSNDERYLAYLKADKNQHQKLNLWIHDVDQGQDFLLIDANDIAEVDLDGLSDEEKARRERLRVFTTGINEFWWYPDSKHILFSLNGDLYSFVVAEDGKNFRKVDIPLDAFLTDVRFSPKGRYISFVADQNLYAFELQTQSLHQLTTDGAGPVKNAMAEFVAQEEMARMTGYWWSPDEARIAFTQVDESPVAIEKRIEVKSNLIETIDQRYPKAGANNVAIKLGILTLSNPSAVQWTEFDDYEDLYFARGKWANESQFSFQIQNRAQTELNLHLLDVNSGTDQVLLREKAEPWINLHNNLRFLEKSKQFIWSSERSGFSHLYLYNYDGELINQLTSGDWVVKGIVGVDRINKLIYFLGTKGGVSQQHLYVCGFEASGKVEKLTEDDGWHDVMMSAKANYFADIHSAVSQPPCLKITDILSKNVVTIVPNTLEEGHPYHSFWQSHVMPEFSTFKLKDGTELQYKFLRPKNVKKAPLVVIVYGGPHAQMVTNSWLADRDYWAQTLVAKGFAVLTTDNRGSFNRGLAFEAPLHKKMGFPEVDDQSVVCEHIFQTEDVDRQRVGIFGWSYGGYMTIRSMLLRPELYKVGVSVAPVTDWLLYDTHYTERYMGHPNETAECYKQSDCLHLADRLIGKLLLVHGMADDNVLYTHSTMMYKLLQEKRKLFDVMAYPGAKHGITGEHNRIHLFNKMTEYFENHL